MGDNSCVENDRTDDLAGLTPSAKLVFRSLQYAGELTQRELAEETRLGQRTVWNAVRTLGEDGAILSRVNFRDARQDVYSITPRFQTDDKR